MKAFARWLLRIFGWQIHYTDPCTRRYVMIVSPHTSNWDFPIGYAANVALGLQTHWLGKHTLFKPPFGFIMKAMGGIPVYRDSAENLVSQVAQRFAESDRLILAMTPEGTRSKVAYWKSGFWRIARAAGVPIVMATLDYGRKQIVVSPPFHPGDDRQKDFERIDAFYSGRVGKHPQRQGPVRVR